MVVSGAWRVDSARYQRRRRVIKLILERWLPLLCRGFGGAVALAILAGALPDFDIWSAAIAAARPLSTAWFYPFAALCLLAAVCYTLGIMARLAAVLLIALAGVDITLTTFSWSTNGLLLICAILVLQMGGGAYALWQPEEDLLRRRAGEVVEESG